MKTLRQQINIIFSDNPYGVHPSRLEEWQDREAIKLLANEIDSLKKEIKSLKNAT